MDPNIDCAVKIFYNLNCIDNFNDFHSDHNSHRAMNYEWEPRTRKQFYMNSWKREDFLVAAASEDNCEERSVEKW